MVYLKVFFAYIMTLFQIVSPLAFNIAKGDSLYTSWSPSDDYKIEDTIVLEKNPDKDFVVLNFTDLQMKDAEALGEAGQNVYNTMKKLVDDLNPDLITVTGDNAWSTVAYIKTIEMLDSFGIPWAPVMGNHDGEGTLGEAWCASSFVRAENCLFRYGPKDMGYGNYIINITENGEVVHTLYMMDTHSGADFTDENGNKVSGYDTIWKNQEEWYSWAVNGINEDAGKKVESSLFIHIPLYEYRTAWAEAYDTEAGAYRPGWAETSFGVNNEAVCSPPVNTGFFSVIKALDSTKNVLCGHDHINDTSIVYDGVRLTYALKTGPACYWNAAQSGGTTLTISSDGSAVVQHHYVTADMLPAVTPDFGC